MPGDLDVLRLVALKFFRILDSQHLVVLSHEHHFGTLSYALPIALTVFLELFGRSILVSSQGICGFWIIWVFQSSALRVCYIAFEGSLIGSERSKGDDENDAESKANQQKLSHGKRSSQR